MMAGSRHRRDLARRLLRTLVHHSPIAVGTCAAHGGADEAEDQTLQGGRRDRFAAGAVEVFGVGRLLVGGTDPLPDLREYRAGEQAAGDTGGDLQWEVQGLGHRAYGDGVPLAAIAKRRIRTRSSMAWCASHSPRR